MRHMLWKLVHNKLTKSEAMPQNSFTSPYFLGGGSVINGATPFSFTPLLTGKTTLAKTLLLYFFFCFSMSACKLIQSLFLSSPACCLIVRPDYTAQSCPTANLWDPSPTLQPILSYPKWKIGPFLPFTKLTVLFSAVLLNQQYCQQYCWLSSSNVNIYYKLVKPE